MRGAEALQETRKSSPEIPNQAILYFVDKYTLDKNSIREAAFWRRDDKA